jgi:hypothetical protein
MRFATGRFRLLGLTLVLLLLMGGVLAGADSEQCVLGPSTNHNTPAMSEKSADAHSYSGFFRVFVTEIKSRYSDASATRYDFGVVAIPLNQAFSLEYGDTIRDSFTFDGPSVGIVDNNEGNIKIMAAVYNGEGHAAQSDTGTGTAYPYTAHYVDAAVGVLSGETIVDDASDPSTHTVFLEEGTSPT